MVKKLTKTASFTDIHWGAKSNSKQHNQDCLNYIDWFCSQVQKDRNIDNIIFMGDWFENRSAINVSTMKYAYDGIQKLNSLGLPIYFIAGNHDLYYRNSREIHSLGQYNALENVTVIDVPTVVKEIHNGVLLSPYLFHDEYKTLTKYKDLETWWGHFEFKGFVVTGYSITMPTGPDHEMFDGPKHIFSGHFHKRQATGNVVYIGNAFPLNYGDAGDVSRGMITYDHVEDDVTFIDWEHCPRYIKTRLSTILDKNECKKVLHPQSRVRCIVDIPIDFEESTFIRDKFIADYDLREFEMEEAPEISAALSDTETNIDWDNTELATVDDLVVMMLTNIESEHIDNNRLITIYNNLKNKNKKDKE